MFETSEIAFSFLPSGESTPITVTIDEDGDICFGSSFEAEESMEKDCWMLDVNSQLNFRRPRNVLKEVFLFSLAVARDYGVTKVTMNGSCEKRARIYESGLKKLGVQYDVRIDDVLGPVLTLDVNAAIVPQPSPQA